MSNFKEIDGVFVNLDLVKFIDIIEKDNNYIIRFLFDKIGVGNRAYPMKVEQEGYGYKTKEQAEERIREIIKLQNQKPFDLFKAKELDLIKEFINLKKEEKNGL